MMKFIYLFIIILSGCNLLECENVKENKLSGIYRNKKTPNQLITINGNQYQFSSPQTSFSGKVSITDKSRCEITFDDWKLSKENDNTCMNGCYNTVIVNDNQLIFDVDNYDNNFYKEK